MFRKKLCKCKTCKKQIDGKQGRRYCSECKKRICSSPGCETLATRTQAGLCESCYCRLRRTGSTDKKIAKHKCLTQTGYIVMYGTPHPLTNASGLLSEHRKVLYDSIGQGPHPCFWCGVSLDWCDIKVDHLNDIKTDNRCENLLVACNSCNRARGASLPFLRRMRASALPTFIEWAMATASLQ
jgi:5-methylcytosine-specific restriction endonuclease McrA